MFVSKEQETYYKLFTSLLKLTVYLDIELDIEYLVQDALTATSNAPFQVFNGLINFIAMVPPDVYET